MKTSLYGVMMIVIAMVFFLVGYSVSPSSQTEASSATIAASSGDCDQSSESGGYGDNSESGGYK